MARKTTPDLPGVEGEGVSEKRIKAIDDAADEYVDARDKRMTLGEKESECREKVLLLMKRHNLTTYRYDGQIVTVTDGLKVNKVKSPKDN